MRSACVVQISLVIQDQVLTFNGAFYIDGKAFFVSDDKNTTGIHPAQIFHVNGNLRFLAVAFDDGGFSCIGIDDVGTGGEFDGISIDSGLDFCGAGIKLE